MGALLLTRWMFLHRSSVNCFRFLSLIRDELAVVTGHRSKKWHWAGQKLPLDKSRGLFTPGLSTITGSKHAVKPSIQCGERRLARSATTVEPTLRGLRASRRPFFVRPIGRIWQMPGPANGAYA